MRSKFGVPLAFMLMNSFATSADTLAHLAKYKDLQSEGLPLEFCQVRSRRVLPTISANSSHDLGEFFP